MKEQTVTLAAGDSPATAYLFLGLGVWLLYQAWRGVVPKIWNPGNKLEIGKPNAPEHPFHLWVRWVDDSRRWHCNLADDDSTLTMSVNRTWYRLLWVLEVLAFVGVILPFTLPLRDYQEFIEWRQHPSPETYKAYLEKQRQELGIRFMIAAPLGVAVALLAGPLIKHGRKSR